MNCSEAHTKEMVLSKVSDEISKNYEIWQSLFTNEMFMIKDLRKALKWVPGRRILK